MENIKFLNNKYKIEDVSCCGCRWFITFKKKNKNEERLLTEISKTNNNLFVKNFVTDKNDNYFEKYNPMIIKGGYGYIIKPEYRNYKATKENTIKLIKEIEKEFYF